MFGGVITGRCDNLWSVSPYFVLFCSTCDELDPFHQPIIPVLRKVVYSSTFYYTFYIYLIILYYNMLVFCLFCAYQV